ncbi:DUF3021 domain-containing protein [Anaerorhabdus sp.]|uniref:DUF3021 domain-containing protein n=1 Tax=Anaerorhabdus sp. TaxID=1872524 RepID=UPI002FCAC114
MKKRILLQVVLGSLIGVCISFIVPLFISMVVNDGNYYPVALEMQQAYGNQLNAVIIQVMVSTLYGAAWGIAPLIFTIEKWSLLRQTVTHLLLTSLCTFPAAYICYWMDHSVVSIISYFSIFVVIYLGIWVFQYLNIKNQIKRMNHKIHTLN